MSRGRIIRIKLKNFLTYDNVEIFPSFGLNLIIGLNGTGKSSVVCGICLGLAGKPQFTGRTTKLSDFIKHGYNVATIEIELENASSRNMIITRKITSDNKSTWMLDGKPVNVNDVKEAVEKMNIQTNNLCQFLPQERVADFAKMDKKQRLDQMLQAIGDQDLMASFDELKQLRSFSRNAEADIARLKQRIDTEVQINQALEPDVQKQSARINLIGELKICEQKKRKLEYNQLRLEHKQHKKLAKECKEIVEKFRAELNEAKSVEHKNHGKCTEYTGEINSLGEKISSIMSVVSTKYREMKNYCDRITEEKIDLRNKLEQKKSEASRLQDLEQQISCLQKSYEEHQEQKQNAADEERQLSNHVAEIKFEISQIIQHRSGLEMEKNNLKYEIQMKERECAELLNEDKKKMDKLKIRDFDAYKACEWLLDHKHLFKKTVHFPIFMTIKVHEKEDVKFIENHIAFRDMVAFVCEDQQDSKLLVNRLCHDKDMKLRINTAMAPGVPSSSFTPDFSIENYQQFNFRAYLKDLFSAPDAVMSYLCSIYNIHKTPVGNEHTERHLAHITEKSPFSLFYTPENRYAVSRSKYGNRNKSVTSNRLRLDHSLISSSDSTEKLQIIKSDISRLHQSLQKIENDLRNTDESIQQKRIELGDLKKQQDKIAEIYQNLKKCRDKLNLKKGLKRDILSNMIDEDDLKKKSSERIHKLITTKLAILAFIHKTVKPSLKLRKERIDACFAIHQLSKQAQSVKREIRSKQEALDEAEKKFEMMAALANESLRKGKELHSEVIGYTNENTNFHKDCENFPDDFEELEHKIAELKAKIDLNVGVSETVVAEFNNRKKDIAVKLQDVINIKDKLANIKNDIENRRLQWLASLEGHIHKVNNKFKAYYKYINCAGEIFLDKTEYPDDFDKYGLQIQVKYRENEPLKELSQTHHSGGECNVAAIIFILSLQDLTDVPFRCIDEINQGMDSINERKVFELISESACNDKSSQYFLLTPKLLPDLTYHKSMKIHIIHNGPELYVNWELRDFINIAKS